MIGDGLRSRTHQRRTTEVDVAIHALNRMLELGGPISRPHRLIPGGLGLLRPSNRSLQHGRVQGSLEHFRLPLQHRQEGRRGRHQCLSGAGDDSHVPPHDRPLQAAPDEAEPPQ